MAPPSQALWDAQLVAFNPVGSVHAWLALAAHGLTSAGACWRRWSALLLLFALGHASHAHAWDAAQHATEASVKAAYLYKFASYIEWPPAASVRADGPVTIGVSGADDIAAELHKIKASAAPGSRAVDVRVVRPGDSVSGLHILFFGDQDLARLARHLNVANALPVLTVTESQGGLGAGSIINFVQVSDRIRFEVSLPHADRSSIKVSVRLLNVALRVEARKP